VLAQIEQGVELGVQAGGQHHQGEGARTLRQQSHGLDRGPGAAVEGEGLGAEAAWTRRCQSGQAEPRGGLAAAQGHQGREELIVEVEVVAQLPGEGEHRSQVHRQARQGIGLQQIDQAHPSVAGPGRRQDQGGGECRFGHCRRPVEHLQQLLKDALPQGGGEEVGDHHRRDGCPQLEGLAQAGQLFGLETRDHRPQLGIDLAIAGKARQRRHGHRAFQFPQPG